MKEYEIERAFRDQRLNRIGAGTDEVMLEVIGRSLRPLRKRDDRDRRVNLPVVPTDEEVEIRNAVRGICESFGGPEYHRRIVEADEPPTELWNALGEKGYIGVNLPERYGGGGLGMHALQAVGEEISAAGCSLLLIVVSPAIVGSILTRHGTERQRGDWLPGIAAGTTKIAFAITEPDAGTNSHNLSTAATREGDVYKLRGTKTFISGVEDAQAILVIARKREEDGSLGLPLLMLVDTDAPGLEKQFIPVAVKASDKQWTLFFDDVEVPGRPGDRRVRDRRTEGRLRRAQPGADHGRRGRQRRRAPGAHARLRLRQRAQGRGTARRSAHTRASPIRSPRRRSSSSWPA